MIALPSFSRSKVARTGFSNSNSIPLAMYAGKALAYRSTISWWVALSATSRKFRPSARRVSISRRAVTNE
ncbi:hypothetical protein D3C84_1196740 [compost metagenome]